VSTPPPSQIMLRASVVVARERIDHPWQEFRWRPIAVEMDPAPACGWQEIGREGDLVLYRSAPVEIELHRKETPGYVVNLETGAPEVYVVLRPVEPDDDGVPLAVHLASASPHEVQAHGHDGSEVIEPVAMPEALTATLADFVRAHHVDEPFRKRRRDAKQRDGDEHLFGQERIDEVRRRMAGRAGKDDGDA